MIEEIEQSMRLGTVLPQQAAEYRVRLAGEYSFHAGQLEVILVQKSFLWNSLRPNYASDTATERAYEATEDGINEIGLRWRIKRCEKMMNALSSLLKVAEGQAKNQW